MTICTIVTNDAITTMKAGMRTLSGMKFFSIDIAAFEQTSTNKVARPIDRPVMAVEVVPSVGHMPRIRTNVGLRFISPS